MAGKFDGSLEFNTKLNTDGIKKGLAEIRKEAKDTANAVNQSGKSTENAFDEVDTGKMQNELEEVQKKAKEASDLISKTIKSWNDEAQKFRKKSHTPLEAWSNRDENGKVIANLEKQMQDFYKAANPEDIQHNQLFEDMVSQVGGFKDEMKEAQRVYEQFRQTMDIDKIEKDFEAAMGKFNRASVWGDRDANRAAIAEMEAQAEKFRQIADPNDSRDEDLYTGLMEQVGEYKDLLDEAEAKYTSLKEAAESVPEIKVQTDIDQEGMEKGSGRMQAALDSLKGKFVTFGQEVQMAISGAFISLDQEETKTFEDANKMAEDFSHSLSAMLNAQDVVSFSTALDELERKLQVFKSTAFQIDGNEVTGEDILGSEEFKKSFDDISRITEAAHQKIQEELSQMAPGEQVETEVEIAKQAVTQFEETVKQLQNATTPADAWKVIDDMQAQIQAYAAKPFSNTATVEAMQAALEQETQAVEKMQEIWNSTHFETSPFEAAYNSMTQKWQQMPSLSGMAVNAVSGAFTHLATLMGNTMVLASSAAADPIGALDRVLGSLAQGAVNAAQGLASFAANAAGTAVGALKGIAQHALEAAQNLAKMGAQAVSGAVSKIGSIMTGLGSAAEKSSRGFNLSFGTLLKYGFGIRSTYFLFNKLRRALVDGFTQMAAGDKTLSNSINDMKTALSNLKLSFASAFAPIANIVLPALTSMINVLVDAISAVGMFVAALTGQSSYKKAVAANNSYASAANSAADAAGSAADAIAEEKRQLAGFDKLEILSGNSSSGGSGGSGGGGGGGGGGGNGGGVSFVDVPIDNTIGDWVQKFKDMFANGDWEGIGKALADGINSAFEKIDELIKWENVGETITKYVDAFCAIFNSMVDNIDWALIGKTFGDGINTILYTVDRLLTGIDWENLGKKFAEGLNSLVDTVDWEAFGKTLGDYFNARISVLHGIVTNFNWKNLGSSLATGLSTMVNTVDWDKAGETLGAGLGGALVTLTTVIAEFDWAGLGNGLAKGINKLVQTLDQKLNEVPWGDMGTNFATGLNNLVSGVNWEEMGKMLAKGVNGLTTTIYNAVTTFEWSGVGASFANFVNGVFSDVDFGKIGGTLGESVKGILSAISTALENIDWGQIAKDVEDLVAGVDWSGIASGIAEGLGAIVGGFGKVLWTWISDGLNNIKSFFDKSIDDAGGNVAEGVLNGIATGFSNIVNWVKENIIDPFVTGFKKAFGINSPATEPSLVEAAGFVGEGILNAIGGAFGTAKKWVEEHILGPISDALKGAKIAVDVALEKAQEWAGDVWDFLQNTGATIKKTLSAAFEKIGTWAGDAWEAIKSGSSEVIKTLKAVKDSAFDTAKKAWDTVTSSDAVKTVKGAAEKTFDTVKSAFEGIKPDTVTKTINGAKEKAFDAAKSAFDAVTNNTVIKSVSGSILGTFNTAKDAFNGLSNNTATKSVSGSILGTFNTAKNTFNALKSNTATKTISGTGTQSNSAFTKVKNAFNALKSNTAKKTITGTGTQKNSSFWKAKKEYTSLVSQTVKKSVTAKFNGWDASKIGKPWAYAKAHFNTMDTTKEGSIFNNSNGSIWSNAKAHFSTMDTTKAGSIFSGGVWSYAQACFNTYSTGWKYVPTIDVNANVAYVNGDRAAKGGIFLHGERQDIPQYAAGGRVHGTMFIAGEAGPEIVGHVGGRTEVLNKSQLASTMYDAVRYGMAQAINALGSTLVSRMAECTNAISSAIVYAAGQPVEISPVSIREGSAELLSQLTALHGIPYAQPAIASGTVLPYSVRRADDIQEIAQTITASNDEMTDVMIQAIAGAAAQIVTAIRDKEVTGGLDKNAMTQHTIDTINRRTMMFQTSPLRG